MSLFHVLFHAFLPSFAYLLRTPSDFLSNPVQFPSAHIPHLSVLTALAQLFHQLCRKRQNSPNGNCTVFIPRRCFWQGAFWPEGLTVQHHRFLENFSAMFLGMVVGEV